MVSDEDAAAADDGIMPQIRRVHMHKLSSFVKGDLTLSFILSGKTIAHFS